MRTPRRGVVVPRIGVLMLRALLLLLLAWAGNGQAQAHLGKKRRRGEMDVVGENVHVPGAHEIVG